MSKPQYSKKSHIKILQNSVEDDEKEWEVIQDVLQNGNFAAFEKLPININKFKQKSSSSVKQPKQWSQKEIERREEQKKLKEINNWEYLQNKWFKERKGKWGELKRPNLIEPWKHKKMGLIIENKLWKDCREMFNPSIKDNTSGNTVAPSDWKPQPQKLNSNKTKTQAISNSSKDINNNTNNSFRKTVTQKIEIDCIDPDKKMDEEYLKIMTEEEKEFFKESTPELFSFWSSINLLRFIESFIREGYDMFEDFLTLTSETWDKFDKKFLNQNQQKRLLDKWKEYKDQKEWEEIERKQAEEFKKAVDGFRSGGNPEEINTNVSIVKEDANTQDEDNKIMITQFEIVCCWNCMKSIEANNAIIKAYQDQFVKLKKFCSEKCVKEFEIKQRARIICFKCNKLFDMTKGFLVEDEEKFCSVNCRKMYIEKRDNDIKDGECGETKEENKERKEVEEEEEEEEEDYDPMEDF